MWTIVRDPAKRSLSSFFFFHVSHRFKKPTNEAIIKYLENQKNFQVKALQRGSLRNYNLEEIIEEMDFIAVAERMDESLVVFRLLFGLEPSDMIVFSSKKAGTYDLGRVKSKKCDKLIPSFVTPQVEEYISTAHQMKNRDYILYAAANASLDRTIDSLGRKRVEEEVELHRSLQAKAEKFCLGEAKFPCSREGVRQAGPAKTSCYNRDWGCGHECIRNLLHS